MAETVHDPLCGAAGLAAQFAYRFGDISLDETLRVLTTQAFAVHAGDMRPAETLLIAHAAALNGMFLEMAGRAARIAFDGGSIERLEVYWRMALRAQTQCRATIETLGAIKNPPAVFARQVANFANGSQQVYHQALINAPPSSRTETSVETNKLLEAAHGRMDAGAAAETVDCDPALAPVGALDGPADARGEGSRVTERRQRRRLARVPRARQDAQRGTPRAA